MNPLVLRLTHFVHASAEGTTKWLQRIREGQLASGLCERTLFDEPREKLRDFKEHQFRRNASDRRRQAIHCSSTAHNLLASCYPLL